MKKAYLIIVMAITMFSIVMCAVANNLVLNDALKKAMGFTDGEENFPLFLCIPLYLGQLTFSVSAIIAAVRVIPSPEKGVKVAGAMLIVMNAMTIIFSVTVLLVALKAGSRADNAAAYILLSSAF